MRYLVSGSSGPGFSSPEEAKHLLENVVHPSFDRLQALEAEGKVLGGGLPVGDRTVVFIVEAESHQEADSIVQGLSIWPLLEWEVLPLVTFGDRKAQEQALLAQMAG